MRWYVLILAVAALVWLGRAAVAPIDHGIDRAAFGPDVSAGRPLTALTMTDPPRLPRPNIVVILADDLGWGDVGVQGGGSIATPNLDRLATEGMRLTDFYASAPICSPSRAGLLTGRYPLRSGIMTAMQAAEDSWVRRLTRDVGMVFAKLGSVDMPGGENIVTGLPAEELTIAEALRHAGYTTMAVGKWHLGDFTEWPEYHPDEHGFERFVGFNMSNDDWPVAFWRDREQIVADIGLDQERYTRIFTEAAVEFIERPRSTPFFLYLAHKDPHQPFFPSEPFAGSSGAGPYGDAVAELDWSIGEVVAALEREGLAEDTLVIVTSDNGPWYEGSSGGLRGRKGQSYEGGFRVPFVAWWPKTVPAGLVDATPAMNIDLLPTFLALAGLALPTDRVVDGVSLAELLRGGDPPAPRPLFFFHDYDVEAVRRGRWKLLASNSHYVWPVPLDQPDTPAGQLLAGRDYQPPGASESIPTLGTWPLLYDLVRDPAEAYNVADHHPNVVAELSELRRRWHGAFLNDPRGWR